MWDRIIELWTYPLITLSSGAELAVDQIVLVIVMITVGLISSRWIERAVGRRLRKTQMQRDAILAIRRVLFYFLVSLVAITALSLLHVPLAAFAFVSGAVAIGVGFGAQNIFSNLISGWILMYERPVRIGDFVEVEGMQGAIEVVGNRSTRIRRVDGVHMLVPNSVLLERTVINWTLLDKQIRTTMRVGVAYGSPVRDVERLIYEATNEHTAIKTQPAPVVIFEDFGDNALIFEVYFWADVTGERALRQIRSDLRFRLSDLFAEHGITIAYPQRDVHLDASNPLKIELIGSGSSPGAA